MPRTLAKVLLRHSKITATAVAVGAMMLAGISPAAAAPAPTELTVSEGESVKTALADIAPGGTINVGPGTYTEELRIVKPVTIVGTGAPGSVIFQSPAKGERKLVDVYNTQDVTLENLTLDGSTRASDGLTSTGVDANSVQRLTLTNVTAKNFAKNGISVTAQHVPDATLSGSVALNNVTVADNGWSGIAFYTLSNGKPPVAADIVGATFTGTTTVTGNSTGIQFGDGGDVNGVTGEDGGPVALGTVVFSGNEIDNVIVHDTSVVTIDRASQIDGRQIVAADFPGIAVIPVLSTTSTVSVSPTGSVLVGAEVTVSASVTPKTAGTFEVFDGATSLGSGAASDGAFTLATSSLSAGSHNLTAVFTAASPLDYAASTSQPVAITVNEKQTTPVAPPAADSEGLADIIADNNLDVEATTASFVPSNGTETNPLDNFDTSKPLEGELPWANGLDSFVDVYAYSTPVFVGTFPVVNGKVQITGVDLSALEAGGHQLVFIGQTSQEIAVMAITVAAAPVGPDAPADPAGSGEAGSQSPGGLATTGADPAPLLVVASILALMGLALLVRRRKVSH